MIFNLLNYLEEQNVTIVEARIPNRKLKAIYFDQTIVIDKEVDTEVKKKCLIAEEAGHHETTFGDILDQSNLDSEKQEKRARRWAHDLLIDANDLANAFQAGCRNRYEIAEYVELDEEFLEEAIQMMIERYGNSVVLGNFVIQFEPLQILRKFD